MEIKSVTIIRLAVLFFFIQNLSNSALATTYYVNAKVDTSGSGTSWSTALKTLSEALVKPLVPGDQIWVAQGTYRPGNLVATSTFELKQGVTITGGFVGYESQVGMADWRKHPTILSGALYGKAGFYNHVVTAKDITRQGYPNLRGFIIEDGLASGSGLDSHGGGLHVLGGSPWIEDCTFRSNSANIAGGGVYVRHSSPWFENCIFINNSAEVGGGMYNYSSSPVVANTAFLGNEADDKSGGGVYATVDSHPILTNCLFSGNTAVDYGGGLEAANSSEPRLYNCTFSGNSAGLEGGAIGVYSSIVSMANCILWGNTAPNGKEIRLVFNSDLTMHSSDIDGLDSGVGLSVDATSAFGGTDNVEKNPEFMDADGPDNIYGTLDDNLRLAPGSSCINHGDKDRLPEDTTDIDGLGNFTETVPQDIAGYPRIAGHTVDMGAYERIYPIYVRANSAVGGDGTSWATAHKYLQDALDSVDSFERQKSRKVIWVAEGTYKPNERDSGTSNNRSERFDCSKLESYGGFAGSETLLSQRDLGLHKTILSGEINGNHKFDNSYRIVQISDIFNQSGKPSVLDGFVITGGFADDWLNQTDDFKRGAGMYLSGNAIVNDCAFLNNWVYTRNGDNKNMGGAIYIDSGNPTVVNCIFSGNKAEYENIVNGRGGGIYIANGRGMPEITNCSFSGNYAADFGGGIYIGSLHGPKINNCIFWQNSCQSYVSLEVMQISAQDGWTDVGHSCIQGLSRYAGSNNIDTDPSFVDADGSDNMFGTLDDDLRLRMGSPSIDQGLNAALIPDAYDLDQDGNLAEFIPFDLDNETRFIGIIDMGAYELNEDGMDTDEDDMDDAWEIDHFGDIVTSDGTGDADDDDLTDLQEFQNDTDPNDEDTDDDGMQDGWEVGYGLDPLVNDAFDDADDDGFCNWREYLGGTDPANPADMPDPFTIFVDDDASGLEDGTAEHPFDTIKEGIDFAGPHDTVQVANGTYTGQGNKNIDFQGKAITVRSQSGNPDACIIDCEGDGRGFHFHSNEGASSVVEGILIKNGYADVGGGILCENSSPTFNNVYFSSNQATDDGGGLACVDHASPSLSGCLFDYCEAGDDGGGLYARNWSSPMLNDCIFRWNEAADRGGGSNFTVNSFPELTGCVFYGNIGVNGGGACFVYAFGPITDCLFYDNTATSGGGGLQCYGNAQCTLTGCTFSGNGAPNGGGVYCRNNSSPSLVNTIIAFSSQGQAVARYGTDCNPTLACSNLYDNAGGDWVGCIAGQAGMNGNISEDPLFCNVTYKDFTLHEDSPCALASCGLMGALPVGCASFDQCEGDFDADGDVDGSDLSVFADAYAIGDSLADLNNDGNVDTEDLATFAADFGRTDCP